MARTRLPTVGGGGLDALRRSGSVTETLFLYECQTQSIPKLRVLAERLGLTVQAVSHLYRQLARRGWVEVRGGQYSLTVGGRAALQGTLSALAEEIGRRLERLQIVRTTRAVARRTVRRGQTVALDLVDGVLTATPGARGGSHGRAGSPARAGELVEVTDLEGIVPITAGSIAVWVIPRAAGGTDSMRRRVAAIVRRERHGLLVAQGLEAIQLVGGTAREPVVRFGAAAACLEASQLGVNSLAFVAEEELPRFLTPLAGPSPPSVTVTRLG